MSKTPTTPAEIAVETLISVKEFEQVTLKDITNISNKLGVDPVEIFKGLYEYAPLPEMMTFD